MTVSSVEAREVRIAGKHLRCQVCDYTRFFRREASLSTGASTTFGQDWANSKANCFICEQCGFVHWFARTHSSGVAAEDTTLAAEIEGLRQRLEAEYGESLEKTRS
jgi:predicted nucleic-acid-binding Zn-ribbon protein